MHPVEQLRCVLFVGTVAAVYVLAMGILIRVALQSRGYLTLSSSRRSVWFRRVILAIAALGVFCIAYGFVVEPNWLEVTHVRIESTKLGRAPARSGSCTSRTCTRSPRHTSKTRLPGVIAAEKPDLVVFTGDSLDSPRGYLFSGGA